MQDTSPLPSIMELPPTPAHTVPSQQAATLAIDSITAEDADPTAHAKTTDSASLLVITSQSILDLLQIMAPLLDAGVPAQARVVPALDEADLSQQDQRQLLQESFNKTCSILHSVRASAYHNQQKVQANFVNTSSSPITPPYSYTADCVNSTVADSALKNVQTFNGEVAEAPQQLQEFLRSIFDLAQTHKITRETTIRVLQRKCTSVARVLVDAYLETLDITAEDSLLKLTLYMESKWSLSWSPSLARARLTALSRTHQNSSNYSSLQASIIKLSHLASLDQPQAQRASIVTASQLSAFTSCLSKGDQSLLLQSDAERTSQGIQPHTLASAVDFLLSHHASRNAHTAARSLMDRSDSLINHTGSDLVMYGRERYNTNQREEPGKPRAPRPRFASAPPQSRGRDPSRAPRPGGWGERQARQAPPRRDRTPGPPDKKGDKSVYHTCETAGVEKGNCIRCNSNQHLMNSPSCRFYNTPIPKNPCHQAGQPGHDCRGGAHYSRFCAQAPSGRGGARTAPASRGARGSRLSRAPTRDPPPQRAASQARNSSSRSRGGARGRRGQVRNAAYVAKEPDDSSPLDNYFLSPQ